jgi:multidrug efflux system outer membrane protein
VLFETNKATVSGGVHQQYSHSVKPVRRKEGGVQAADSRPWPACFRSSPGNIFAIATWELDLFGKLRRATEASRADLLAAQENRLTVWESIIAQVASAYFDLCEYDAELEIVRESIKKRKESVELVSAREKGGVASMLDLDQSRSLVESAQSDAIALERAQLETENLIAIFSAGSRGP